MVVIKGKIKLESGISVTDLLSLVPDCLIEELSTEFQADKWVKKLKAGVLFKLVLYSLLNSERMSLRVMESNAQDPFFKALAPSFDSDEATWTGIRERLMKIKVDFCRSLYENVYEQVSDLYLDKSLQGYHIKRYDSTMIATFSHLLSGMKVGNSSKGKTQVKLTTEFKDDFLIKMDFHHDQAHLSEETALKEAIENGTHTKSEVSVFDKGLKSRQSFAQFDLDGTVFVGRLNESPRYELLYEYRSDNDMSDNDELEFVQDSAVYLYESGQSEPLARKLRLIQYRLKKDGQILSFITNLWEVEAQIIAHIYRRRWDIEVLFRFLKQEMNLTHFVCNDFNAIQVMLYFTLITAMLILIFKKKNGIKSYKFAKIQFFKELFYSIFLDILEQPDALVWLKKNMKKFVNRE
jgi:hypothetical protein